MGSRRTYELAGKRVTVIALPSPARVYLFRGFVASAPAGVLGLDVETTAIEDDKESANSYFDPNARMRLIQFGSKTEAWVLDPHDPIWREEIYATLDGQGYADVFEAAPTRFVSHSNYDAMWVRREFDIDLGRDDRSLDTHTMTCLLDPGGRRDHTLKTWATRLVDGALKTAEEELHAEFKRLAPVGQRTIKASKKWGFTNIPLEHPLFTKYAGLDAIVARILLDELAEGMRTTKERKLSRREQIVRRIGDDIEWRGLRVDPERAADVLGEVATQYEAADAFAWETFGFTPRSPRVKTWLADRGVEFTAFTPTGQGKLDKDTIPDLARKYEDDPDVGPIINALKTMSETKNLLTNMRIITKAAAGDGFAHPHVNTNQGNTGRMSVVRPAVQTFKKTDKRLRGVFIARDGYTLVGADYDSQEIRLAAAFSQDPEYLRIIENKLNQHDVTAQLIYGTGGHEIYVQRQRAKILNFLQQYGGGPKAIVRQIKGINLGEAKTLWYAWRKAYAGLVEWSEFMSELAVVVNPWGRRIPRDPWRPYANGNYMIQSSGRDLLGDALVRIREAGHGDWIWLPIHDEIILEVPDDPETIKYAKYLLERAMYQRVQGMEMTATAEHIGKRWNGEDAPKDE